MGESPRGMTLENELKAGKYGVIRSLLRVLEGGAASKVGKPRNTDVSEAQMCQKHKVQLMPARQGN